jgi:hypothetical protein
MTHDAHPPGVVGLLVQLREAGAEVVHHPGGFVGIRGRAVGQVPPEVWQELSRQRGPLRRMVRPEPTPFAARRARGLT